MQKNINKKNQIGGMLLELILMVSVLVIILPIIQRQAKKQIELSENILVVKDMLKLHTSIKSFLEEYKSEVLENVSSSDGTVCSINLSAINTSVTGGSGCEAIFTEDTLEKHSIYQSDSTNILGKTYSIYLRVLSTQRTQNIEVVILGEGGNPIKATKSMAIIKELGSYGAYIEAGNIVGFGWSSNVSDWSFNNAQENDLAVVFTTNAKTGNYISKKYADQNDFNKMSTALYLSLNNINDLMTLNSKYIMTNYLYSDGDVEMDSLVVSQDTDMASPTFDFTNLYTNVLHFPSYTGEGVTINTLTLVDNGANPIYTGDIYFYGEAESTAPASTGELEARSLTSEKLIVENDVILGSNQGFEISGYVRANSITADNIDSHMIFGDNLYFNNRIYTGSDLTYYIDLSATRAHIFKTLVIKDASEFMSSKTLYNTSFGSNSSFADLFNGLSGANTKLEAYVDENINQN